MKVNVLNEEMRLFEMIGSAEEIDVDGEFLPMEELEPTMPVFMDRGAPLTAVHTANVIGRALSYDFVEIPGRDGNLVRAVKLQGKIYKNYKIDDAAWEAIKRFGQAGGATGSSWFGFARDKYDPITGATKLLTPQITSWGLVFGNKEDGTPFMPKNRSSTILDVNLIAKADGDNKMGTVSIRAEDGSVQKFALHKIEDLPDKGGVTLSAEKAKTDAPAVTEGATPAPANSDFVTRDEFNAFAAKVMSVLEGMKPSVPPAEAPTEPVAEAKTDAPPAASEPAKEEEKKPEEDAAEKAKSKSESDNAKLIAEAVAKAMPGEVQKAIAKAIADGSVAMVSTPRPGVNENERVGQDAIPLADPRHPNYAVNMALGKIPMNAKIAKEAE